MILCFYLVPAFAWFAACFSPDPSVHRCYSISFFVSHMLVETYLLVLPIMYYAAQWSDPSLVIPLHPIFHNSASPLGEVTIKMYLIINSCVAFSLMILTTLFTCVLCAYTKELKQGASSRDPAKEPLVQKSPGTTASLNNMSGQLSNRSSSASAKNAPQGANKKSNAMY